MLHKKHIQLAFFCSCALNAKTFVQTSIDPARSKKGESVVFKIKITHEGEQTLPQVPSIPQLSDWDVLNSYQSSSPSVSLDEDGNPQYTYRGEFSYVLKPLHTGKLSIPEIPIRVGSKTFKTPPISVQVDQLAKANNAPPTPRLIPPSIFDDEEDSTGGATPPSPHTPSSPYIPDLDQVLPRNTSVEDIFVKGKISSQSVYKGEMIILNYSLYVANTRMMNPEIRKFPDLKGFLKEDLFIVKQFANRPVQIRGKTFHESELIRYAIFPIQTGKINIEPLEFRGEYLMGGSDLLQDIITGQGIHGGMGPVPFSKSSESFMIDVKPLPTAPENSVFTGGVGNFQIEWVNPPTKVLENESFHLKIKISGRGNFKSIEEIPLNLGNDFEVTQSKSEYEFKADATGTKTFEYLILPKKAGDLDIPSQTWTYFDPKKAHYFNLSLPALRIYVEPKVENKKTEDSERSLDLLVKGAQDWKPLSALKEASPLENKGLLFFIGFCFCGLFYLFDKARRKQKNEAYFHQYPWQKTAQKIRSLGSQNLEEKALLVDQWIRERLRGALRRDGLTLEVESPREIFLEQLEEQLAPEYKKNVHELRGIWNELDLLRFANKKDRRAKIDFNHINDLVEDGCKKLQSGLKKG